MIAFSPEAQKKIRFLYDREESLGDVALRVYVKTGGCHGLESGMLFDTTMDDGDTRLEVEGVPVVMDTLTSYLLRSSVVEYHDTLMQSGFEIANPKAKSTCGCGASFSSEELPGKPAAC